MLSVKFHIKIYLEILDIVVLDMKIWYKISHENS